MNLLSAPSMSVLAAAGDEAERSASNGVLILAALVAIATIVVLITTLKLHPFLALIAGSAVLGIVAQYSLLDTLDSFSTGFGSTAAGVGILIALGAMIGKLLADSGGADRIVETITSRRLGSTAEVADIIFFLCSEQASYVAGSEIHINGGQHV